MVSVIAVWGDELKDTLLAMLEAGKTKGDDRAWEGLHHDFISRGHRVRLMRRATGLVVVMTAVSSVLTANTTSGFSGFLDTMMTFIIGMGLALFIWRLTLSSARQLALLLDHELRSQLPDEEVDIGDIRHPSVIFAPWIPNSRRRLKDVLVPFALRRKR